MWEIMADELGTRFFREGKDFSMLFCKCDESIYWTWHAFCSNSKKFHGEDKLELWENKILFCPLEKSSTRI